MTTSSTISAGRSIGTLNLALRELGQTDPKLLEKLEARIGPARFLALITANGTLVELFSILRRTTPSFAGAMLKALDEETV